MSADPQPTAQSLMVESINAEADAQVRRIIDAAKATAREEFEKTEEAARALRSDILAKANDRAQKLRERELSLADAEARRAVLNAREASVRTVFDRLHAELNAIREDDESYSRSLAALAAEARAALGEPTIRLTLASRDRGVADRAVRGDGIEMAYGLPDERGGLVAESCGGRTVFDNTYTRRAELAARSLRAAIIEEISKHHD